MIRAREAEWWTLIAWPRPADGEEVELPRIVALHAVP
jgi:hypothetical protein